MAYRQTYLKVDLDAVTHNIKAAKYRSGKEVIAVIKANGYGAGDVALAQVLIKEGVAMLAVSSLDEALHLRKNNIRCDILVLGYTAPKDLTVVIKNKLSVIAPSLDWVKQVSSLDPIGLKVHVKVDTKMNRLGITNIDDWLTALVLLKKLGVNIEGAMTHYASSDDDDNIITTQQYQLFEKYLRATNTKFKWIHASNSDACFHFHQEQVTNAVRVGVSLLGYAKYDEDLLPSLSLYTRIALVKHVPKGETISYNCTYTTSKDEIIATLPIGYADGLFRRNQNRYVYVNGDKAQIVGVICMDQCMIRLEKEAKENDEVEIFGPHINLHKMAEEIGSTAYEFLTLISPRVTRVYYHGKNIKKKPSK